MNIDKHAKQEVFEDFENFMMKNKFITWDDFIELKKKHMNEGNDE